MKAIVIKEHGCIDALQVISKPEPICPPNKIKINIKACSINHLDIWVRNGIPGLNIPLPLIMGSDASGTIVEVGTDITRSDYYVGQDVIVQPGTFDVYSLNGKKENYSSSYGILGETEDGVQAEYVLLKPDNIYPKPNHLSFQEAASIPLVFMTSYQMLVERAEIKKDDVVLIYGGTSGVGMAAIQIAKEIGCIVITTVGNDEKREFVKQLNPDYILNHQGSNLYKEIRKITNRGVDVVFEHIGPATWKHSLKVLAIGGRIVTCGATTGNNVTIDLRHLFMKQQSILGSTMGSLSTFRKVISKFNNKKYNPYIDSVYTFDEIKQAHIRMEDRKQFGKIIVTP
ncbi:MAG: alcohol dehydrogenase [Candidatus Marinimicrobia bacterium]|nr:alcohol dehydrogenase [Candidatus Neomarinimicrobiota bacterium]|tara:strand:- start:2372 stop:3397 length:1026 start_codon:yes stop_codon:yes gene_type:complete